MKHTEAILMLNARYYRLLHEIKMAEEEMLISPNEWSDNIINSLKPVADSLEASIKLLKSDKE